MEPVLLAAGFVVFVATIVQTVTGAGLGLMAGPVLLMAMGSHAAIQVAVILNLALSLALLPRERAALPRRALWLLLLGSLVGLPVGLLALHQLDVVMLKLIAGIAVTSGGLQMLYSSRREAASDGMRVLPVFGVVSGAMTSALAIPGPAALWGLSRTTLTSTEVRAALRAFFTLAYGICLAGHLTTGVEWHEVGPVSAWLALPLMAGMMAGLVLERFKPDRWLRPAFMVLVLAMGLALLLDVGQTLSA